MATTSHSNGTVESQGDSTASGPYVVVSFPAGVPPPPPAQTIEFLKSQMSQGMWDLLVKAFDKEMEADVDTDDSTNPPTVTNVKIHR